MVSGPPGLATTSRHFNLFSGHGVDKHTAIATATLAAATAIAGTFATPADLD